MTRSKNICQVRQDLNHLYIPVGSSFIAPNRKRKRFSYRWLENTEDTFQINFNGKWVTAISTDFDF